MISVTILTKNSQKYIEKILDSLRTFPEVVVLDSGSFDETLSLAKKYPNVRIHTHEFSGFGKAHNLATSLASHDWIFSLDSDEVPTAELIEEILSLTLDPKCVYSIWRKNIYRGKWIRGCGWYPDRVVRIYNRKATSFSNDAVHEKVLRDGLNVIDLKHPAEHVPYASTQDFLSKMRLYSELFAEQYSGKKSSSTSCALLHGIFAFLKSYLLKCGIFLGSQGFEISAYNGITAFYKYLALRDINAKRASSPKKT
jgi:glycosyltransferase involved in cell wall biosynthesis